MFSTPCHNSVIWVIHKKQFKLRKHKQNRRIEGHKKRWQGNSKTHITLEFITQVLNLRVARWTIGMVLVSPL